MRRGVRRRHRDRTLDASLTGGVNTPVESPELAAAPDEPAAVTPAGVDDATFAKLAHEVTEYLRNLLQLFLGEVQIARGSVVRMLIAGALIPVFLLTIWAALNLLIAAIVSRVLNDWIYGYLAILLLNGIFVALLVMGLKRWKRDLTLPRSRDALARLLERIR
jgi:hypothetical protein